jgi:glycosyltransferase involved in cell wall biosynthesis
VSEKDAGHAHAINKGFSRATGQIYAYLNSDDLLCPGILEHVADVYRIHPNPSEFFHATSVQEFSSKGALSLVRPKAYNRIADWIERRAYLHQPATYWSADAYKKVGGFDESLCYAFDRKFFMELVYRGCRLSVERDLVGARFRRHPESKTETVGETGFFPEFEAISNEFLARFGFFGRLNIRWQSRLSLSQAKAEEKLFSGGPLTLSQLLSVGLQYPPVLSSRFFLGAVRRKLFDLR